MNAKANLPKEDLERIIENVPELKKLYNKTILLTGASGFLGRCFLSAFDYLNKKYLHPKKGCNIICLDNNICSAGMEDGVTEDDDISFFRFDITKELPSYIKHKHFDFIINAAGLASPKGYKRYPIETMDVSYIGTKNILDLSVEYDSKVLLFSSSEVYATPPNDKVPTTEDYIGNLPTTSERSCYDIGKTTIETLGYIYKTRFNSRVKIVRPFNVYGAGMSQQDFRVLPNFISSILQNKPMNIYGNGLQTRTFCYLSDAITGFLQTLFHGKNGEIYNIGNDSPEVNMFELANKIINICDKDAKQETISYPDDYPSCEPLRRCPSIKKAREHLGYEPKISLDNGLVKFYKWAKENYTY